MNDDEASTSKQFSMGGLENALLTADTASGQSEYYTSIDENYYTAVGGDAGRNARVFPTGNHRFKEFESHEIIPLDKIGEGGQGSIYEALVKLSVGQTPADGMPEYKTVAIKLFKGSPNDKYYGQWPEEVYGLGAHHNICDFQGYCKDFNGSFGLLMSKYDGSLRDVIDEQMVKNSEERPFESVIALYLIIQIALGMAFAHKGNVMHRDLKADNVFVYKESKSGMPWSAFIGDFDTSDSIVGTRFWRAPEILEALLRRRSDHLVEIPFTPMSDVYSFAMTCYEILTGGIPFQGCPQSDYTPILSGRRPDLPVELNLKMRDLICRCWSENPQDRPTFHDIVSELRDMVAGLQYFRAMFETIVWTSGAEECLAQLECIFKSLRLRYPEGTFVRPGDEDFVLLGFQCFDLIKSFIFHFGLESYIENPILPWSQWLPRRKLHIEIKEKMWEFQGTLPYLVDYSKILELSRIVTENISEARFGSDYFMEDGVSQEQVDSQLKVLLEGNSNLAPMFNPVFNRHQGCLKKHFSGHYEGDEDYPICDLCKTEISLNTYSKSDYFGAFRLFEDETTLL